MIKKIRKRINVRRILKMKVHQITKHVPWLDYRTVTASESPLLPTQMTAASIPQNAFTIAEGLNHLEVRISAEYEGRSGTAYFYAARKDDDICLLGSSSITSGEQVSSDGKYYVDTMTLTDLWITEVKRIDGDGNNGMSRIAFDVSGYDVFFMLINYTPGSPINKWYIDVSGF